MIDDLRSCRWICGRQRVASWVRCVATVHSPARKQTRNQQSATTLLGGTLFCESCEAELKLIRSTTNYKQIGCTNGKLRAHSCQLSASKSTRIVEECLLGYLRDTLLTEDQLKALVARTNEHLAVEAAKPKVDTQAWKDEVQKLQTKIKKLLRLIEGDEDEALCVAQNERIKQLQGEINALQAKIREANGTAQPGVKPLTIAKARKYLEQLRETLNADIPVAAQAIRVITGPIKIRQDVIAGRPGARWYATFSPDLVRALRLVGEGTLPSVPASAGSQPDLPKITICLEKVPRYEQLAPSFKQLHDAGKSIQAIAAAHQMTWQSANEILKFAQTGLRPKWKIGKGKSKKRGWPATRYIELAPQVVKLRDQQRLSFVGIAKRLAIGKSTVRRAYD